MNYKKVHISTIQSGDTVKHDNKVMTVGKNDISYCAFMGTTLFGDSYHSGYKSVLKDVNLRK